MIRQPENATRRAPRRPWTSNPRSILLNQRSQGLVSEARGALTLRTLLDQQLRNLMKRARHRLWPSNLRSLLSNRRFQISTSRARDAPTLRFRSVPVQQLRIPISRAQHRPWTSNLRSLLSKQQRQILASRARDSLTLRSLTSQLLKIAMTKLLSRMCRHRSKPLKIAVIGTSITTTKLQ